MRTPVVVILSLLISALGGCKEGLLTEPASPDVSASDKARKPEIERYLRLDELLRDPGGFNSYYHIAGTIKYSVTLERALKTLPKTIVDMTVNAVLIPQDTDAKPTKLEFVSSDQVVLDEKGTAGFEKVYPLDEIRSGLTLQIRFEVRRDMMSIIAMQMLDS